MSPFFDRGFVFGKISRDKTISEKRDKRESGFPFMRFDSDKKEGREDQKKMVKTKSLRQKSGRKERA